MKKIIFISAMLFALAYGTAFAGDMSSKTIADASNGITIFTVGPAAFDSGSLGPLALGSGPVALNPVAYDTGPLGSGPVAYNEYNTRVEASSENSNGITIFAAGPAAFDTVILGSVTASAPFLSAAGYETSGAGAGGYGTEASGTMSINNGITIFAIGPVAFDSVPMGSVQAGAER